MKEILKIFFSIRKEPFHFFPISVCWALILQLFRRCPGNNYCRHVAGILMIIGKPTGLVGAEQPVCQAKKYCKQFSELKTILKEFQAVLKNLNQLPGIGSFCYIIKFVFKVILGIYRKFKQFKRIWKSHVMKDRLKWIWRDLKELKKMEIKKRNIHRNFKEFEQLGDPYLALLRIWKN